MTSVLQSETASRWAVITPLYRRVKSVFPLLKWIFLALIAYAALRISEGEGLREKIANFPIEGIILFLALGLASRLLYSLRWQLINRSLGMGGQTLGYLFRINLLSEFVSIVLPSYLGGEGVRLLKLRQRGGATREILVSQVIDRILGVTALLLLTAVFLPFLLPYLPAEFTLPPALLPLAIGLLLVSGLTVGLWVRKRGSLPLPSALRGLHVELKPILIGLALSALGHFLYATGYFVLFRALSAVDYAPAMAVTLVALLTASVPLSVFGVDVSDGSLVVLAGLLAVEPGAALIVVALVVASRYFFSLCGLVLELIADGRQIFTRSARQPPETKATQ
jgi:hypothetical protein